MTSFAFYCTYIQLKTEQLMYSTNSGIQWLQFVFLLLVCCIGHSRNDLRRWCLIHIVWATNFKQIGHAGVWPESPGMGNFYATQLNFFAAMPNFSETE